MRYTREEIDKLVEQLNNWTESYNKGNPEISDKEWDNYYFELQKMEKVADYYPSNSPTETLNMIKVDELKKVNHSHLMLSLDKTKDLEEINSFLGNSDYVSMLKMDGLTVSLTYEDGKLVRAETRGDGVVGEDITHNALVVPNIPNRIPAQGTVIIDGEIIIRKQDFESMKEKNPELKNARNLASGSIRLLNAEDAASRHLYFVAWDVIPTSKKDKDYIHERLEYIEMNYGFTIVPYFTQEFGTLEEQVNELKKVAEEKGYPIDGCVFKFESDIYGKTLGRTDKFFKNAMAYKFYDELYDTKLINIEWSMGRTGQITPVAVFEPVEILGSVVERASLHNYSVMKEIMGDCCYAGQRIKVAKMNMIIPQVVSAVKMNYGEVIAAGGITVDGFSSDMVCPCCGAPVEIEKSESGVLNLYCDNPNCEGKIINQFDHFCGKKGLDIKGLSKKTLEKLLDWKWIANYEDIFELAKYRDEWIKKSGFGPASVDKILKNIQLTTIDTPLNSFISALGIPLIGRTVAKEIENRVDSWQDFRNKVDDEDFDFSNWEGFGIEKNLALKKYDYVSADMMVDKYITFKAKEEKEDTPQTLDGVTVVITGKLSMKRDDFKALIEAAGGKVTNSVTKKTDYLITDTPDSGTAKNKKAKELGVTIITENDFRTQFEI